MGRNPTFGVVAQPVRSVRTLRRKTGAEGEGDDRVVAEAIDVRHVFDVVVPVCWGGRWRSESAAPHPRRETGHSLGSGVSFDLRLGHGEVEP